MSTLRTFEDVFQRKISLRERALFYEHIASLLEGGVTLMSAIRTFIEKTGSIRFRTELMQVMVFIQSGDSFSTAMKKLPRTFDRRESAIVEAGEQTGGMQKSLGALSEELRMNEELISKVKSALTYPLIVFIFLLIALCAVMVYVIPQMLPLFSSLNADLPFSTQSLVSTSDFLRQKYGYILLLFFTIFVVFRLWISTDDGRLAWDKMLLRSPVIGRLTRDYLVVRTASTLGLLISAGIPILRTFELAGEAVGNTAFKRVIDTARTKIQSGEKITTSLEDSDPEKFFFPPDVIQMIGAGEQTSTLNVICVKIATRYRREVDYSIANLVKFVEPAALLIAAIFVAWFAIGIFAAIIEITQSVEKG